MTLREARKAVRLHWAEFILNADSPPPGTDKVWASENARIAKRLGYERAATAVGELTAETKR